jgi:predicted lipase
MNIIADMWRYAVAVSHDNKHVLGDIFSNSIYVPMSNKSDSAFMLEFDDRVIIAFSGTKNLSAWMSNVDVYPLRSDFLITDGHYGKGTIAGGFYTGWSAFKNAVTNNIRNNCYDKPIYCTGHSRGGTLAILCARHIAKNIHLPCSCIAFGSPAPGNKICRDEIDMLPINLTRVVNGYDIVTTTPPSILGFKHPGKLHWLPVPKINKYLQHRRIKNHYYSSYTKAIMKYCREKGDRYGYLDLERLLTYVSI